MELVNLLQIVWRRLWVIVVVMAVTGLGLGYSVFAAEPTYEAQVKLQITAPQQEDVTLFDSYRAASLRDELAVARNNFIEVLQSRETYNRTIAQLGLTGADVEYSLDVRPLRDADFLYVIVRATTPYLAEAIANVHTSSGIAYYGEVRAKPTTAAKNFFVEQLHATERDLQAAEQALNGFKQQHGIASLDSEIEGHQVVIQQLQTERYRVALGTNTDVDAQRVDTLLQQARQERERLVSLAPTYNVLEANVQQTRGQYQLLQSKYTEALLKADTVQTASFIQIVEAAEAPLQPAPAMSRVLLVLALVGSLGVGVLLALLLDSTSRARGGPVATPPADGSASRTQSPGLPPGARRPEAGS